MTLTPVLLLGYNRPEKLRMLISSLAPHKPPIILIAVDGPKIDRPDDMSLVLQTQNAVNDVSWTTQIETRFRVDNLGLRHAVVDAVNWAVEKFGRVIVLEDDVVVGPEFLQYATFMLEALKSDNQIAHINGYNVVPETKIGFPNSASRLSRYLESFAWATWERAWSHYDEKMIWANSASIHEISAITGDFVSATKWKLNFDDVKSDRINSWAYRWLATMWANNWMMVSPNRNLVSYNGWTEGTHTRRKAKWSEIQVSSLPSDQWGSLGDTRLPDELADAWLGKRVFGESILGVAEGLLVSTALESLKLKALISRHLNKKVLRTD